MWPEALEMLVRAERLNGVFFRPAPRAARTPVWEPPADVFETAGEVLVLMALHVASLGAAACDSQSGCGQPPEETSTKAPPITCGAGTHLQAGQCVATEQITTR